jgi:hypothetical protein
MRRIVAGSSFLAVLVVLVTPARAAQAPADHGAAPVATSALLALAPDRARIALAAETAPTASVYISATAVGSGSISPSGQVQVTPGSDQTFTMTASPCAVVDNIRVDGADLGPLTTYTFHKVLSNHTIEASFVQAPPDTIVATTGAGGTISPAGAVPYDCGTNATYTITPDVCSLIRDVLVDGISQGAVPSFTFKNLQASHTIAVSFVPGVKFTITADAGANGTTAPSGAVQVDCGSDQTFTFAPSACYQVADVLVDGVSQGPLKSYTFTNVHASHLVSASFMDAAASDTITASAGPGGTIAPAGATPYDCGTNATYTITPAVCFLVADVLVDGVSQGAVPSFTFKNLKTSHTIAVSFVPGGNVTITANAGANGTITPSGAVPVHCGSDQTFTPSPNGCYQVADVLVDGVSQGPLKSYTFTNVHAPHVISASFVYAPASDTITASAGPGGAIDPAGTVTADCGTNRTFTLHHDPCYRIDDVVVDGVSKGAVSSFTFTDISASHTITASFAASPQYPITASAGTGGTIVPSGTVQVVCGASQTFTFTPDLPTGHAVVIVDAVQQGSTQSYTFTNVNDAHSIAVQFLADYSITVALKRCVTLGQYKPVVIGGPFGPNTTYWFDVQPLDCDPPQPGTALARVGSVQTDSSGDIVATNSPCFDNPHSTLILDLVGSGVYVPLFDPFDCFSLSGSVAATGIQDLGGEITPEGAVLSWWLMDVSTYRGFVVHRAPEGGDEEVVTPTPLTPPASHPPAQMRWRDESAVPGARYAYRIEALKSAGSDWYGPVKLAIPVAPKQLALRAATPNPFSGTTRLALDMPANEGALRLDVFDVAGRHVRTLRRGPMSPGQDAVDWDGLDDHGARARGGLYVVRVQGARGASVLRIMKLD